MLVLMPHRGGPEVEALLRAAAEVLAGQAGCLRVDVLGSPDDPLDWQLLSEWHDAGSLRHGLGSFAAKMALGPLQSSAVAGGGVFEVRVRHAAGSLVAGATDRAADADTAGPSR